MSEVLIAGQTGGREHALGELMANDGANKIYFSHGNGGSGQVGTNLGLTRGREIVDFAVKDDIDLVLIGPEAPLVAGLAGRLRKRGLCVFGPDRAGAQLEASKAFAAEFMLENGIPQPNFEVFSEKGLALEYAKQRDPGSYVIKADGLAGGKGVVLPKNADQSNRVIKRMLDGKMFGEAGRRTVLQERISGPELSAFVVVDGKDFVLLPLVQDHKRLKDGDRGPNTGGMGAYTPVTFEVKNLISSIQDISERTVRGLRARNIDYRGVLFLGLMLDEADGHSPKVIEYNVRFGDPETQVLVTALKDSEFDLPDLIYTAARGSIDKGLEGATIDALGSAAVTICLAAPGYPNNPQVGDVVYGIQRQYPDVTVYHGATEHLPEEGDQTFTTGGRVAYVTGTGQRVGEAASAALAAIGEDAINFKGMQYREDIGHQAVSKAD